MANILLIEDNETSQQLVSRVLERDAHEVTIANNGKHGLELVEEIRPDLIICDWMMPEMNGIEVCRRIKANPVQRSIPIILLTARNGLDDLIIALDSGADDFMSKPFNPDEFRARVRCGLRMRGLLRELEVTNEELTRLNSALSKSNDRLRARSHKDDLTELPNRRAMEMLLPSMIQQIGKREETNDAFRFIAVCMVDIDNFKNINDKYGHHAGDDVLKISSRRMVSQLPSNASLYRYGGDEFIAVLPGFNKESLERRMNEIIETFRNDSIALKDDISINVRISVGAAILTGKPVAISELVEIADKALYQAKDAGRDSLHIEMIGE